MEVMYYLSLIVVVCSVLDLKPFRKRFVYAGIIHASDEKDFKTAYSYFYEGFEGFDNVGVEGKAIHALKYMLLTKILLNLYIPIYSFHGPATFSRPLETLKSVKPLEFGKLSFKTFCS